MPSGCQDQSASQASGRPRFYRLLGAFHPVSDHNQYQRVVVQTRLETSLGRGVVTFVVISSERGTIIHTLAQSSDLPLSPVALAGNKPATRPISATP